MYKICENAESLFENTNHPEQVLTDAKTSQKFNSKGRFFLLLFWCKVK